MVPKIFIVDDTQANPAAMRHPLAHRGVKRFEATSGSHPLRLCVDHDSAVILLGNNMRGETEHLRDTPIIFLTAVYPNDMNQLKGYRPGTVDYVAKSVNEVIPPSEVREFPELYAARERLQQALNELAERNKQLTEEIAERKRVEAVMRHQAMHDPLTSLPNRTLFGDRLSGAIQRANRHQNHFAMAYIDIDGFKAVNDNYGHAAGDALLQEIAARLLAQLRANDTVARLGGDEFGLILEEIESPQAALKLCEKLDSSLAEPYVLRVNDMTIKIHIGASIGIAPYQPNERADADERLMHAADVAMYEAKRAGKNRCVLAQKDQ